MNTQTQELPPHHTTHRLIRLPAVKGLLGVSAATIWRMRRRGDFPAPIQVSPGAVAWRETEIIAWIEARAEAGR